MVRLSKRFDSSGEEAYTFAMKRLALAVALLLAAFAAQAFDPQKPETIRIGIIKSVEVATDRHATPVRSIPAHLRDELRRAGFDAFTIDTSIDDLANRDDRDADFYIEVDAADHYSDVYGGIDVYSRYSGVNVGVVKTNIETRIRVYDGKTMDLFAQFDLDKSNTMVTPTNVGIGGRHGAIWAGLGLPFGYLQYRRVAREVAKVAAVKVADAIRIP